MISDEELTERLKARLLEEWRTGKLTWWYLSFADDNGWKGAVVIQAYGPSDAMKTAWDMGINPGGSALPIQKPEDQPPPPAEATNRLLNREEVEKYLGPVRIVHR